MGDVGDKWGAHCFAKNAQAGWADEHGVKIMLIKNDLKFLLVDMLCCYLHVNAAYD